MADIEKLNEEQELAFVDMLIEELPQYGIDTSTWEHDYGDCCYGGAMEFIARCIKDFANKSVKKHLDELFKQCEHGDEGHRQWLRNKFDSYLKQVI